MRRMLFRNLQSVISESLRIKIIRNCLVISIISSGLILMGCFRFQEVKAEGLLRKDALTDLEK